MGGFGYEVDNIVTAYVDFADLGLMSDFLHLLLVCITEIHL